jgi:hypothetical protein
MNRIFNKGKNRTYGKITALTRFVLRNYFLKTGFKPTPLVLYRVLEAFISNLKLLSLLADTCDLLFVNFQNLHFR